MAAKNIFVIKLVIYQTNQQHMTHCEKHTLKYLSLTYHERVTGLPSSSGRNVGGALQAKKTVN